jgi:uncharacterized Zn-finger protein
MNNIWIGDEPTHCDICEKPLGRLFIDGKTIANNWAIMCPFCHDMYGVRLGIGLGQLYIKLDDGSWVEQGARKPTE